MISGPYTTLLKVKPLQVRIWVSAKVERVKTRLLTQRIPYVKHQGVPPLKLAATLRGCCANISGGPLCRHRGGGRNNRGGVEIVLSLTHPPLFTLHNTISTAPLVSEQGPKGSEWLSSQ